LWASNYENDRNNLMQAMDKALLEQLLENVDLKGKRILDYGCGTGRHWKRLLSEQPESLAGCDTSEAMLKELRRKFPEANTRRIRGQPLSFKNGTIDIVISNLTIGHIEQLENVFREWDRFLKSEGEVIITAFHPEALRKGAQRSFQRAGTTYAIKNFIHSLEKVQEFWTCRNYRTMAFYEKCVDSAVKEYYKTNDAVEVYEVWKGVPYLYGYHFKRFSD